MTDLGFQIGYIAAFWVLIVLLIATSITAIMWRRSGDSLSGWGLPTILTGLFLLVGVVLGAIFAFPYNAHYWKLYSVEGKLTNISSSFQSSGKSISNYYVLTLSGHNEYFVTENPRILDLKGDTVDLVCHANYVYQGQDNYDCNIRSVSK